MTPDNEGVVRLTLRGRQARGRYAVVDADLPELPLLLSCRWYLNDKGYARTFDWPRPDRVTVKLHQAIIQPPPGLVVDHINGDRLDNRRSNLRLATDSQNTMNRRCTGGKVPYRGVSIRGERFHAKLRWQNEYFHLGDFRTAEDAARMYDIFSLLIAGDFAHTNFDRKRYQRLIARLHLHIGSK